MRILKLIRDKHSTFFKDQSEVEKIEDKNLLNELYAKKIKEELQEIQNAQHKSLEEFADLLSVLMGFAKLNGFYFEDVLFCCTEKIHHKGKYTNVVLNNLNPNNPSNKIYFQEALGKKLHRVASETRHKQKSYFSTRNKIVLKQSIEKEKELDELLKEIETTFKNNSQTSLF